MDSINHLTQKLLQQRARNQSRQEMLPETAPPPYSESETSDDEDDDKTDEETPIKLIINSAHQIQGSNNLVPTSSTPLADATKFSTLLLHAVNQINAANARAADGTARGSRRPLKVDLIINCGLKIIGDRNVVGAVGIKPKAVVGGGAAQTSTAATPPVVAGAKRKAEHALSSGDEWVAKKVALGEDAEE